MAGTLRSNERLGIWAIPLLAGIAAIIAWRINPFFPLDDAYITLHNARTLLSRAADPVYGGSALGGATSLVHLALVAALGLLLPLEIGNHLLLVGAVILYALGLVRLAAQHGANLWLVAALGLASGHIPFALVNGLETGLAMATVIWLVLLIDSPRLGWLAGLAPFVRPELGLLALLLMARQVWQGREQRRAAAAVARTIVVALPFLIWSWLATGSIVPSTAAAKLAFFAESAASLETRVQKGLLVLLGSQLVPLLLCAVALPKMQGGRILLAWTILWLGMSIHAFPSGLYHNEFRYLTVLVPAMLPGWIALAQAPRWRFVMVFIAAFMPLSSIVINVWQKPNVQSRFPELAADARKVIPPTQDGGTRVLVHDAGFLAWQRPDLTLIDLVGLKTPSSTVLHQRLTATGKAVARTKALSQIATASRAAYLVELSGDSFWSQTSTALRETGWTVTLINRPPSNQHYHIYRLTPPLAGSRS